MSINTKTIPTTEIDISSMNTSQSIRYLHSVHNMDTKTIHKFLQGKKTTKDGKDIRYQHVRNVLITPINQK